MNTGWSAKLRGWTAHRYVHRGENAPFATSDNAPYVVFSLSVSRCFLQFYSADLPNAIAHASGFDAPGLGVIFGLRMEF